MKMRCRFCCVVTAVALAALPAFAQQSFSDAYNAAGAAMKKGDFDSAITGFTQAIALAPGAAGAQAYNGRGFAKLHKGDLDGALADFNRELALHPLKGGAYYGRALVEQAKGTLDAAIADYQLVIAAGLPGTGGGDNPQFYLWLTRTQQNQKADADKGLSDYVARRPAAHAKDWHSKIAVFLLGQLSETDLMTYAVSMADPVAQSRAQCEGWYFIGMKRLIAGDKNDAADNFRKCLGTNQTVLTQYLLAKAASDALALNGGQ